jgi:hypothetical protein
MKNFLLFIALSLMVFTPFTVTRAQLDSSINNLDAAIGGSNGAGLQRDLATSISTVVKGVLAMVGTIFLLLTIYAGILWMTAQGEEAKVGKAIQIIKASVVGLIITMSAYAITYFVTTKLGGGAGKTTTTQNANTNTTPNPEAKGCCAANDAKTCQSDIVYRTCSAAGLVWFSGTCPANCKP